MTSYKKIGEGNTAEIYEYSEDKILKLFRTGMSKEFCEHEFYTTKNISHFLSNCPKTYELVTIDDKYGIVYEKIKGKTLLQNMLSQFTHIKTLTKQLAHYHLSIQRPINFELPTVPDKLKNDIGAVNELSNEEKEQLYQYIDSLPHDNILCHFDFHPDNIIMQNNKAVIIDWMTACSGDRLADVARTCILLKYAESPTKSRLSRFIIRRFKSKVYREYIKEYIKIANVDISDIKKWEYPIIAARLREWIPENERKTLLNIVRTYSKVR